MHIFVSVVSGGVVRARPWDQGMEGGESLNVFKVWGFLKCLFSNIESIGLTHQFFSL